MWYKIQRGDETQIVDDPTAYGDAWTVVEELTELPPDDDVAMLSSKHVDDMHAIKAVEALLIVNGTMLPGGLLDREAKAVGVDVTVLAQQVRDHVEDKHAMEIERRRRKMAARTLSDENS